MLLPPALDAYEQETTDDGQIVEFQCVGQDITERKKAENEVRQLNIHLEQRVVERQRDPLLREQHQQHGRQAAEADAVARYGAAPL